jgi:exonuclease SbcC
VACGLEPPRPGRGGLAERWDALAAWADETRPDHEKRAAELDDLAAARTAERTSTYDGLLQRAAALGTAAPAEPSLGALTLAVAEARHDADEARRAMEARLARADALDAEIAAVREQEQVATTLGQLLDKAHFGKWLVDEALRALVGGASELLDRLSGGQYAPPTASCSWSTA